MACGYYTWSFRSTPCNPRENWAIGGEVWRPALRLHDQFFRLWTCCCQTKIPNTLDVSNVSGINLSRIVRLYLLFVESYFLFKVKCRKRLYLDVARGYNDQPQYCLVRQWKISPWKTSFPQMRCINICTTFCSKPRLNLITLYLILPIAQEIGKINNGHLLMHFPSYFTDILKMLCEKRRKWLFETPILNPNE